MMQQHISKGSLTKNWYKLRNCHFHYLWFLFLRDGVKLLLCLIFLCVQNGTSLFKHFHFLIFSFYDILNSLTKNSIPQNTWEILALVATFLFVNNWGRTLVFKLGYWLMIHVCRRSKGKPLIHKTLCSKP